MASAYEYRDTAAATCNNDIIILDQAADGVDLDDGLRLRRSNNTAVTTSCVLNNLISFLFDQLVCLFLCHKCADRLCRIFESRIIRIYLYLCQNGGASGINTAIQHFLTQRILQIVSDVALTHSHAYRQRTRNVFFRIGTGQLRHCVLDHAYLRSISVCDYNFVAGLDQIYDCGSSFLHRDHLLRQIISQCITAKGDYNSFSHNNISYVRLSLLLAPCANRICDFPPRTIFIFLFEAVMAVRLRTATAFVEQVVV